MAISTGNTLGHETLYVKRLPRPDTAGARNDRVFPELLHSDETGARNDGIDRGTQRHRDGVWQTLPVIARRPQADVAIS